MTNEQNEEEEPTLVVWAVIFGNYEPAEVMSLWETEELAKANIPNEYYHVESWPVGRK